MDPEYKYLFIACLAIFLIDALGSIASRRFNFNYLYIGPVSIIAYATLGYTVSLINDIKTATLLTGMLGVFDATIGWKVSILLRANTKKANNHPTVQAWTTTIIAVALYGALIGLISGGAATLINAK